MFPHKDKSALVKKEMRIFQELLQSCSGGEPDEDADQLLEPAMKLARHRAVVKRPGWRRILPEQSLLTGWKVRPADTIFTL